MVKMRLQKFLTEKGIDSRRKCEQLITQGKIKVNNVVVTKLGTTVEPDKDTIEVNNQIINQNINKIYILLNKPSGYLCTSYDPFGRATIYDLMEKIPVKVNYAGRLDFYSEGLVLLTNDGELIHKITHPQKEIKKVYLVKVKGLPDIRDLEQLKQGIPLSPTFTTAPCQVKIVKRNKNNSTLEISICEGKKRQIRRMFSYLGFPVLSLKRTQIGILSLGNLKSGHYRFLNKEEIEQLKKYIENK